MSKEKLLEFGPRIEIEVAPASTLNTEPFRDTFAEPPKPKNSVLGLHGPAIIDTGSSVTLLFLHFIHQLRLPKVSDRGVSGIEHDLRFYPFYLVKLIIGGFYIDLIEVGGIPNPQTNPDYLGYVGRDVLQFFHLSYDGPSGKITLTRP